ncbi:MAG: hypothetical protein R3B54_10030 [Bdellovibrionota bacterium]
MRASRLKSLSLFLLVLFVFSPQQSFAPDPPASTPAKAGEEAPIPLVRSDESPSQPPTKAVGSSKECGTAYRTITKTAVLGAVSGLAGLVATVTVGDPVLRYFGWKKTPEIESEQRAQRAATLALEKHQEDQVNRGILPASGTPGDASNQMIVEAKRALELAQAQMGSPEVPLDQLVRKSLFDEHKPQLIAKVAEDLKKTESDPLTLKLVENLEQKISELVGASKITTADPRAIGDISEKVRLWWENEVRKERLLGR